MHVVSGGARIRRRLRPGLLAAAALLTLSAARATVPGDRPGEHPAPRLDLTTAIERAFRHNRDLARAASLVRAGEVDVALAESEFAVAFRPTGALDASSGDAAWVYGLDGSKKLRWGTQLSVFGQVRSREDLDEDDELEPRSARVGIEVRQPLFQDFGTLIHLENVRLSDSRLLRLRRDFAQRKAELLIQIAETFENIIRFRRRIRTDEAFAERMERLYRLTEVRVRQGRATQVDLLRVESLAVDAESRLTNSRELLRGAEFALAELLGEDMDARYELVAPPLLEPELPPLDEAVEVALEHRLDYAQALQDYADRRRGVRIAERVRWPDLSVVGRYERLGEGDGWQEAVDLNRDTWFIGLQGGRDINPAADRSTVALAEISEATALEGLRVLELSIARQVQQQLSNYRRAQTSLQVAERNLDVAERRVRLARRLFEFGRGDNFSVTDAEETFVTSRDSYLNARAEASLAAYRVLDTLGTLLAYPDELKPRAAVSEP